MSQNQFCCKFLKLKMGLVSKNDKYEIWCSLECSLYNADHGGKDNKILIIMISFSREWSSFTFVRSRRVQLPHQWVWSNRTRLQETKIKYICVAVIMKNNDFICWPKCHDYDEDDHHDIDHDDDNDQDDVDPYYRKQK